MLKSLIHNLLALPNASSIKQAFSTDWSPVTFSAYSIPSQTLTNNSTALTHANYIQSMSMEQP
jgi:hypothetical protein